MRDAIPQCRLCGRRGHTEDSCNMPEGLAARGGEKAPRIRTRSKRYAPPGTKQQKRIDDVLRSIREGRQDDED